MCWGACEGVANWVFLGRSVQKFVWFIQLKSFFNYTILLDCDLLPFFLVKVQVTFYIAMDILPYSGYLGILCAAESIFFVGKGRFYRGPQ